MSNLYESVNKGFNRRYLRESEMSPEEDFKLTLYGSVAEVISKIRSLYGDEIDIDKSLFLDAMDYCTDRIIRQRYVK